MRRVRVCACVVSDVAGNTRGQGAKGPDQGSRTAHERCRGDVGGRGAFPRLRPIAVRRRTDPKLTFALAIVSPTSRTSPSCSGSSRARPTSHWPRARSTRPAALNGAHASSVRARLSPASILFFCTFLTFSAFWSPGGLVGQLKHERAERRDLEFFMDILVKYIHSLPTVPLFSRWPL